MKKLRKHFLLALAVWLVAWVPISFCFQQNAHVPIFALIAPLLGFYSIFNDGWEGNAFYEVTLPWLVFWIFVVAILLGWLVCEIKTKLFPEPPPAAPVSPAEDVGSDL